ncbi:NDP-hexose 2,3-dehydratase family protein [Planctomycetota bacterium]|nr:NDP-hexose 2,3-dehydratase family protein [Planctomycetota bacterium]
MKQGLRFLKSALTLQSSESDLPQLRSWIKDRNESVEVSVERTTFESLPQWSLDHGVGRLQHESGRFFSVDGIRVETNWGEVGSWDQPIINQPEIGYLGFLVREIEGVLHFLVQAKIEPGNVNAVQLSPTLQATRSNFTQVHGGRQPRYLEHFRSSDPRARILDQLQSEQGARFLRKRNRNIIVEIEDEIEEHEDFKWMTLGQIKALMVEDNLVNMDARTVISGIGFGVFEEASMDLIDLLRRDRGQAESIERSLLVSSMSREGGVFTTGEIIAFLTSQKSTYELNVDRIPLGDMRGWNIADDEIYHDTRRFFRVIAVDVSIENREVVEWGQPMVEPAQEGLCAFVCRSIEGVMHFAVQAKLECGNHDVLEFAPTVQCITGNYRRTEQGALPFLDEVLSADSSRVIFDTLQSEEGGRFYREQNRNMLVMAADDDPIQLPPGYIWMTLRQIGVFIRFNNYLNIQARSLLAAINYA